MHGLPVGKGEGEGENKGTHVSLQLSAGSSVIKAMYKEHVRTQHIAQGLDYIYTCIYDIVLIYWYNKSLYIIIYIIY